MVISCKFIMSFMLILVFLFIECQTGIVLRNFKSRRTILAELEKEAAEAKALADGNITNAINMSKDHIKPSHTNGKFKKPSDQISPRMKDETKNSKKHRSKGSLKFKNVTGIMNKTVEEIKLPKNLNQNQNSKPKNQAKIEAKNQTKDLNFPKDKTVEKVMNKHKISTGHHKVDQKVINKTDDRKSTKLQNNLEPTSTIKIVGLNITKTVNRTLNKVANSTISTLVHVNVTNVNPKLTEAVHLNVSDVKSNITEDLHLNVTMAVKPNATEVIQLNVTMAIKSNATKNALINDTITVESSATKKALLNDSIAVNLSATKVDHLNITKTGKSNVTEVLHLNITVNEKTNNSAINHLNFTVALKPNITETLHLNITKAIMPNNLENVQPNVTEILHLNVTIAPKPNVTEAIKPNSTQVIHLNVTEAINSTVIELKSSNVTKRVNTKPTVNTTKVNSKSEIITSFENSVMKGKKPEGPNSTRHVNDHLQNIQSMSSDLNSSTLNEVLNKTKPRLDELKTHSSSNLPNLKEILPVVNNSANLLTLSFQNFNSSLKNSTNSANSSINEINKQNNSLLRDSSLLLKESMPNKTSGIPMEAMIEFNGTREDLNSLNHEADIIHIGQKNVSNSEDISLKLGNTEELKIKSNGTDKLEEKITLKDKIRENTNFLATLTTNSRDEEANLNVNITKASIENVSVSADPIFNFSFPVPLEALRNSTIFESIVNLTKIILTDEINPESLTIDEKPGDETLNKSVDAFLINETLIVEHTQNKTSKQEIFNLNNEKIDKNKNVSKFSEPTKIVNKSKGVESEMVTMVLLPEESNSTQAASGLDFLVNSEVAKNAVLAMDVFNLSDTSLTDHVIEDSDIHSFIDLMMPAVSDSHHEFPQPKSSNGTEQSNSSAQRTTEVESFSLNETSETADKLNESVVEFVNVPSNNSQFQPIEINTTNSTEIIEILKCPSPGLCLFWFVARDTCTHHNQCPGSKLCCRVRCSKHCIDVEPQHN